MPNFTTLLDELVRGSILAQKAQEAPNAQEAPAAPAAPAAPGRAYALLSRDGGRTVELLAGRVADVDTLARIPLEGSDAVLAMVPFRQVRERGFDAHDDGAPLRCLVVEERCTVPASEALEAIPAASIPLDAAGFDTSDDVYAGIVRRVIADEIGRGEGANFVIRRDYVAQVPIPDGTARDRYERVAALTWFRALLEHERGAYWTFAFVSPGLIAVGASPEAHVVARGGEVTMNPISGTFRHPEGGATREALAGFLGSTKETEELFMVVDEELKMMSAICSDGGRIAGPYLKPMSRLTHTEYLLSGRSALDPREILRETMFAPTVTGSPMQNACAVIRRHETSPRGYYSGVIALFELNGTGGHDLDAPILIRTAYLRDGELRVPVGATLVRHSDPDGEVGETHGKAAGVLGAIGAVPRDHGVPPIGPDAGFATDPDIVALLARRNERLATFWLEDQSGGSAPRPLAGRSALVVDAEDRFTAMLAHQLRHLGAETTVVPWYEVSDEIVDAADLLVAGPGPGDPSDSASPRIARMRELVRFRLDRRRPLLAVCLSHQILAERLGLELAKLEAPHQGVQLVAPMFDGDATIAFYNTYTAMLPTAPGAHGDRCVRVQLGGLDVEAARDPESGRVFGLRGAGFASVQGHLESILSTDGISVLASLARHALAGIDG